MLNGFTINHQVNKAFSENNSCWWARRVRLFFCSLFSPNTKALKFGENCFLTGREGGRAKLPWIKLKVNLFAGAQHWIRRDGVENLLVALVKHQKLIILSKWKSFNLLPARIITWKFFPSANFIHLLICFSFRSNHPNIWSSLRLWPLENAIFQLCARMFRAYGDLYRSRRKSHQILWENLCTVENNFPQNVWRKFKFN